MNEEMQSSQIDAAQDTTQNNISDFPAEQKISAYSQPDPGNTNFSFGQEPTSFDQVAPDLNPNYQPNTMPEATQLKPKFKFSLFHIDPEKRKKILLVVLSTFFLISLAANAILANSTFKKNKAYSDQQKILTTKNKEFKELQRANKKLANDLATANNTIASSAKATQATSCPTSTSNSASSASTSSSSSASKSTKSTTSSKSTSTQEEVISPPPAPTD